MQNLLFQLLKPIVLQTKTIGFTKLWYSDGCAACSKRCGNSARATVQKIFFKPKDNKIPTNYD